MKPFDLKAALAGAPLQTRNGLPVKIAGYYSDVSEECQVLGWYEGYSSNWYANGKVYMHMDSNGDLFMAPQKRQGWINIILMPGKRVVMETVHESEIAALLAVKLTSFMEVKTIRIEWEE